MPVTSAIPLPGNFGDEFFSGAANTQNIFNSMNKNRLSPYQIELLKAQELEARGKGAQSQMLADLMRKAFSNEPVQGAQLGNNNKFGLNNAGEEKRAGLNPGESFVVGKEDVQQPGTQQFNPQQLAMQGQQPAQNKYKDLLYALGYLKETPAEQATREQSSAYQKVIGESDVESMKDWNKKINSSYEMMPVLENIQDIISNPKIQEIYKHPEYMNYDVKYAKRFNKDPETQQLLTSLGTNVKSIFSSMGSEFKGAFREFEMNLFNAAAPTEGDSLNQLIAKTNTLKHLRTLAIKRFSLANEIVRAGGGRISPDNALKIASQQINTKEVREQIKNEYEQLELAKKEKKEAKEGKLPSLNEKSSVNPNAKTNAKGTASLYKNGIEYQIPANLMNQALQEGFTLGD